MISATILKDSTNWLHSRITTLILEYPRYIHSEFMTHRMLSKNAASSRAIPSSKITDEVKNNTVYPIWTKEKKGMQGEVITDDSLIAELDADVYFMRDWIIGEVNNLTIKGVHKQNANRYLEPFQYIKVICTGTEWTNFFELRDHPDAMPEIQELARAIKKAMTESEPEYLHQGEWHIPFGDNQYYEIHTDTYNAKFKIDSRIDNVMDLLKGSVARCARISYNNVDGTNSTFEKDLELYNKLVGSNPKHLSPTEHQARVPTEQELDHFSSRYLTHEVGKCEYHRGKYISNLNGWIQYRKLIENETY
jgi:thymidylate synthase ThyX